MKMCWPEWDGPAANGSGTSRFCEVHACCVHSLTHGDTRYHYMAPCRIESVSPDGLTVIAVVEYDRPGWTQDRYNGERLRLDITEVWPPVRCCWLPGAGRSKRRRAQSRARWPLRSSPPLVPSPCNTKGDPMKRKVDGSEPDAGQLLFTYRRTVGERLASGELRDVSREAKAAGFRWPLAVTRRLWEEVQAVPNAHRRTETPKARWQHRLFAGGTRQRPDAAGTHANGGDQRRPAHDRRSRPQPRAHQDAGVAGGRQRRRGRPAEFYPQLQRRMTASALLPLAFRIAAGGRGPRKCYLGRWFSVFPFMSSGSSASSPDPQPENISAVPAPAGGETRHAAPPHRSIGRIPAKQRLDAGTGRRAPANPAQHAARLRVRKPQSRRGEHRKDSLARGLAQAQAKLVAMRGRPPPPHAAGHRAAASFAYRTRCKGQKLSQKV